MRTLLNKSVMTLPSALASVFHANNLFINSLLLPSRERGGGEVGRVILS